MCRNFTRGRSVGKDSMREFVESLEGLPDEAREQLLALTPNSYLGLAPELARSVRGRL